jgi:hypothetical protein
MLRFRLISPNRVPYGGEYSVKDPASGLLCRGLNFESLVSDIRRKRISNSIPIGLSFREEVEQLICAAYPVECEANDPNMPRVRHVDLDLVLRGTKMLLSLFSARIKFWLGLGEHPLVDQAEANRRAEICNSCPLNVSFRMSCTGICPEIEVVVTAIKGNRSTPFDANNRACSICGCLTQAHVWPRLDILDKGLDDEMRTQFFNVPNCWKKTA